MPKLLSAFPLFLMPFLALAANMEEAANTPPVETVPVVYVALFVVLFLALVIGFFAYLY